MARAYLVSMVVGGFSLIEVLDAIAQRIKLHHAVCLDEESVAEVVLQSDPAHVGVVAVLLGADVGIVEIVGLGLVAPDGGAVVAIDVVLLRASTEVCHAVHGCREAEAESHAR